MHGDLIAVAPAERSAHHVRSIGGKMYITTCIIIIMYFEIQKNVKKNSDHF